MSTPDLKNTELLQAMAAMGGGHDDSKLRALYRALRGAMVVVASAQTSMALDKERELFARTYEDKSGRQILVAYTNFEQAPADLPGSVTPFVELCKQVAPLGLAIHINPGAPHGGVAPANWVRAIAEGEAEMPNPAPVLPANLGELKVSPIDDLRAAIRVRLTQGLVANHNVVEAYLAYATPDETPPVLTLCVVVAPAFVAWTRGHGIAEELHAWVRPLLGDDEEIDFLVLAREANLVATFKAAGPPFYRRS